MINQANNGVATEQNSIPMPVWKRALDISFCLAALPVFGLCALGMAAVNRIASPGPILFRQERIGYRNRRFMCYKFRTMKVGADTKAHQSHCENLIHSNAPMSKMDAQRDSRIVPGAWILRATGMDELPQLLNVLKGDMSLVGPRPCVPFEFERFLPWQRERFNAVPGLTGLWQVSGKNRTTYEQMIGLDIRYTQNISWWMDLKIVLLTLPTLVGQLVNTHRARNILAKNIPEVSPCLVTTNLGSSLLAEPAPTAA